MKQLDNGMKIKWRVDYVVGNTYKSKFVYATTAKEAIKKARIKNIIDLDIEKEN